MRKLRLTIEIGLTLFFPRVGWVYPILKKGQSDTFSDTEQWKYGRTKWKFATRYQPNYSMLWRGRLFSLDLTYLCVCVCVFLYNIVLVLPYIDMNLPWVYMCSPSWTPLPHPSYYKQCCNEHWGTCVTFSSGFLGVYAHQWDRWVIWHSISSFYFYCDDFYFIIIFLIFFLHYNIALVLPYINMHLPWVYMCSPSWTPLPHPTPYHPSGSSQCISPKLPVSCIEPGLAIHFLYDIRHVLMPFSQKEPSHYSI